MKHFDYDYLTTTEAADYLRLKERKVYDLVRQGQIPCTKATGKLLFPRQSLDLWLMNHLVGDQQAGRDIPPIVAGSHDPLLEWALRESQSQLATLCHGSGDGVRRVRDDEAMLAGIHLIDAETGAYNRPEALGLLGMKDLVILHWAYRCQGLILPAGNPLEVTGIDCLTRNGLRVAHRQPDAGAERLLRYLLARANIDHACLHLADHVSLSEDDLALAVREGSADVGLGVKAVAQRHGLAFVPLHLERFDLAMRRRSFFEPAVQRLMTFVNNERFRERAETLGGYDLSRCGQVGYNA
ncbi:helix-turn-helix transcriptional regulator [Aidingimonas halophila]|uniref:DNA binding domain-containing protein, excisionase family n=1 Tax=Aidingimonas halophila TaxID=574349 RepID=A0A1H3A615_9GAMM|nr:helix-turn-helix transcriptional regulator [Aidingimonas halophila]GHC21611.1 DNA-binding protein [Aidingimonas halophila]SDX24891.1 DNA binding domain-containing protein, excisionase family [Aidingimonas halophila]